MHRALLFGSLLWSCAGAPPPVAQPQRPAEETPVSQEAKPPNAAPPARTARIVPIPGSPTRAALQDSDFPPLFVDAAQFLASLEKAEDVVGRFAGIREAPQQPRVMLGSVSDHEIRSLDLRALVLHTITEVAASAVAPAPRLFSWEDILGYPRVAVVWQSPGYYRALRLNDNNDNDGIYWIVATGQFPPQNFNVKKLRELPPGTAPLEAAPFLKATKTIYPHVEEFLVCPPDCE